MLINKSNQEYNVSVLNKTLEGLPIQVKLGKIKANQTSHVVCSDCGGLFSKKNFSAHSTTCLKRQTLLEIQHKKLKPGSSFFLHVNPKYQALDGKIFRYMQKDDIAIIVQTDPLILEFGHRFLKSHMDGKQRNYVCSKMRTLATLVKKMKDRDPINIVSLSSCIDPHNFEELVAVVTEWSGLDEKTGKCEKGSVPRRLNKMLKQTSQISWSIAIRDRNVAPEVLEEVKAKHEKFKNLMVSDWSFKINTCGDNSLKTLKMTKALKLPPDEDVVEYFKSTLSSIRTFESKLNSATSQSRLEENFVNLSKSILSYLIALNGRRPSEVAYAKIENYEKLQTKGDLAVFSVVATKNSTRVPIIFRYTFG